MNQFEWKDYEVLRQIQLMCEDAKDWDGPVSFESIWESCSKEMRTLKIHIGERIISESKEKE